MGFLKDDMIFEPYNSGSGGYQCKMKVKKGTISVRYGGHGLITTVDKPYEVWYPDEDTPIGEQTAEDIWNYVSALANVL
jgi:hypothetical protein